MPREERELDELQAFRARTAAHVLPKDSVPLKGSKTDGSTLCDGSGRNRSEIEMLHDIAQAIVQRKADL